MLCLAPQWNSHGYDVAKVFGSKLTSVSPVWLQLRRRGPETFDVTGLHDHDPGDRKDHDDRSKLFFFNQVVVTIIPFFGKILAGWVKAVRKSGKKVRMGEYEAPSGLQVSSLSF